MFNGDDDEWSERKRGSWGRVGEGEGGKKKKLRIIEL